MALWQVCSEKLWNWAASWQNQQNECAPSEDSDQPGHLPSLISGFAVRMKKALVPSYPLSTQRRLWSDWADAQADLSLRWAHSHFVGFVMRWLKCCTKYKHRETISVISSSRQNIIYFHFWKVLWLFPKLPGKAKINKLRLCFKKHTL